MAKEAKYKNLISFEDRVLPLVDRTSSALTHPQRSLRVVISIRLLLFQHGAKVQALDSLISKKPEWHDRDINDSYTIDVNNKCSKNTVYIN